MPPTYAVGMGFSRSPMVSTPLPYLTALFTPYVTDYTTVQWYILGQLTHIVGKSAVCIREGNTPELRAHHLATAKGDFTEDVYLSAASTQLKKDLFSIPFEEFFDVCLKHVKGHTQQLWLLECALHPEADVGGVLAPSLSKYFRNLRGIANPRGQETIVQEQINEYNAGLTGPFAGLTHVLRRAVVDGNNFSFVKQILLQFLQLAMNAADVWIVSLNADAATELDRKVIRARGEQILGWAWCNMLENPSGTSFPGSVPFPVRAALADSNLIGNIHWIMRVMIPCILNTGVPKEKLHYTVYTNLLYTAMYPNVAKDVDPIGIIMTAVKTFPLLRDRSEDQVPLYFRPKGTRDQVTAELIASHRRIHGQGDQTDVPIEPIGPRIDPRNLCQTVAAPPAGDTCTICRGDLADPEEECVRLSACVHLLHLDCLDALINQAYKGADMVNCPSCRAHLCAPRDYKAVLDVEELSVVMEAGREV